MACPPLPALPPRNNKTKKPAGPGPRTGTPRTYDDASTTLHTLEASETRARREGVGGDGGGGGAAGCGAGAGAGDGAEGDVLRLGARGGARRGGAVVGGAHTDGAGLQRAQVR